MKETILSICFIFSIQTGTGQGALIIERAEAGEDASSRFYYFTYRRPAVNRIEKVRILWNGGWQNPPTVTDYHLDESSIHVLVYQARRDDLETLIQGLDGDFETLEEYNFRSKNEELLIGTAGPGTLTIEERIVLSNLIDALTLVRHSITRQDTLSD